jgi:hypothetical protein
VVSKTAGVDRSSCPTRVKSELPVDDLSPLLPELLLAGEFKSGVSHEMGYSGLWVSLSSSNSRMIVFGAPPRLLSVPDTL